MRRELPAGTDLTPIEPLLKRIQEHLNPLQIYLFGSRARGDARPDSDWDLAAIVPNDASPEYFDPMKLWQALRADSVPADVVVITCGELEEDANVTNSLPYSLSREGVALEPPRDEAPPR